jgi:protein-S-isoprenylcysteine O-methyltransferase Ste14
LVTTDLYRCVRHPHHLGVGIFMTSLGLFIGYPGSFLIISVIQWLWILGFLFLVEERELVEKFGAEYKAYRQRVPMLFPKPLCVLRVLARPVNLAQDEPA